MYNPSDFVAMTQTLRVVNAARYYEIGIPITLEQYRQHAPAHFVERLTIRSHHLLALRIAEFLKHFYRSGLAALGLCQSGGRQGRR